MHLVQVVDQLGEILNGINVVVGWGRDQGHTGLAVAQPGDVGIHLGARKLAALTRLGPLGHLDLQLLAAAEIFRRHAEATRSDLLNGGAGGVAVAQAFDTGKGGRTALAIHVV